MEATVEFGELPPDPRGRGHASVMSVVSALQERPGDWAKVYASLKPGTMSSYRSRLRDAGCEVTARNTTAAEGADLWARWPEAEGEVA